MEKNFDYGSDITGLFGLLGIIRALGTSYVGKLNERMSSNKIIVLTGIIIMFSWGIFMFSGHFLIGIIVAVILVDLGQQAFHISNQNIIFSRNQDPRNRVNTVYMFIFFAGGVACTFLGSYAWEHFQWVGVSILGLISSGLLLLVHFVYTQKDKQAID